MNVLLLRYKFYAFLILVGVALLCNWMTHEFQMNWRLVVISLIEGFANLAAFVTMAEITVKKKEQQNETGSAK